MRREDLFRNTVPPTLFTIVLFVIWEIICRAFNIPLTILPAPTEIFAALWQYRVPIIENSWVTLWTTLVGFLLATGGGLLLGIAVGWNKNLYAAIYPVLVGFNSVPKVAVVPILILWFGLGELP
ncbi:MAG: ABC transporter permease, partial [Pusillimonas sp.]|nr:ABC transporter permease [Pusillimonas sp.]